ncbi:hypothetical protein BDZ89DRAFT_1065636 [Hymenopellis radicata]|nr:hypothetical protein BDZ89DRAFT_1065636 [Hymenopellis radicata]
MYSSNLESFPDLPSFFPALSSCFDLPSCSSVRRRLFGLGVGASLAPCTLYSVHEYPCRAKKGLVEPCRHGGSRRFFISYKTKSS